MVERCPTCRRRVTRSSEANRRLWALYHVMSEKLTPQGESYGAESWHLWAKSKFLGCADVKLPNGKVIPVPRSTADLDTAEFNTYMTEVEAWANEHGAFLEDTEWAA